MCKANISNDELQKFLLRQIGDSRMCPHCKKEFIPNDRTRNDAFVLLKKIFKFPFLEEDVTLSVNDFK